MKSLIVVALFLALIAQVKSQEISLSTNNMNAVNVTIEQVSYRSKQAIRLTEIEQNRESLAIVNDLLFYDGTIEVELAGRPLPSANPTARGFIGLAFRVKNKDTIRYDCFYLRPTNGRSDDQVRRNHSAQYIAHPAYPWYFLRKEYPGKYESYVDLVEGEWTKLKIEVQGTKAKLFVHNSDQPSLVVDSLLNASGPGGVALWVGQGTDGYFRNLKITKH